MIWTSRCSPSISALFTLLISLDHPMPCSLSVLNILKNTLDPRRIFSVFPRHSQKRAGFSLHHSMNFLSGGWKFEDVGYKVEPGTGFVAATLPLGGASYSGTLAYEKPWGVMLHAKAARTAANTATGIDDLGASSALGGIFAYQVFSSDGNVTVKAQHASTNSDGSFADLTGATSGVVDATSTPQHGLVALSTSLTINRYLRWQIAFSGGSTVTFACALIRNGITT